MPEGCGVEGKKGLEIREGVVAEGIVRVSWWWIGIEDGRVYEVGHIHTQINDQIGKSALTPNLNKGKTMIGQLSSKCTAVPKSTCVLISSVKQERICLRMYHSDKTYHPCHIVFAISN